MDPLFLLQTWGLEAAGAGSAAPPTIDMLVQQAVWIECLEIQNVNQNVASVGFFFICIIRPIFATLSVESQNCAHETLYMQGEAP